MLFSLILLVIMVLWRPSNNNQRSAYVYNFNFVIKVSLYVLTALLYYVSRFAFSPLLDNLDDDDEEDLVVNSAFCKLTNCSNSSLARLTQFCCSWKYETSS